MRNSLLLTQFLATPWALMPERLQAMHAILSRWSSDAVVSNEPMHRIQTERVLRESRRRLMNTVSSDGIVVLPLYGVLTQRGNMVDDVSGSGCSSTQQFALALRNALEDESVKQILIDIDSPGGSVYGIAELAAEIIQARNQKPIVAVANSLAASAAYWIACCASEVYVTPGGEVGSIGVWQAHFDESEALAAAGIKPTLISAGKYKVEGNSYLPLDEEAHRFMQTRVDDYYADFTKAVAVGRNVSIAQVQNGMGQGRVLGAEAALAQNMVDGIASFNDVINKMRDHAKTLALPKMSRLTQAQRTIAVL